MLRAEDVASTRRNELEKVRTLLENIGTRLGFTTSKENRNYLWQENGQTYYALHVFASALVRRAISETPYPPEQTLLVIPGGRATLLQHKLGRDARLRKTQWQVLKFSSLRRVAQQSDLSLATFPLAFGLEPPIEQPAMQIQLL